MADDFNLQDVAQEMVEEAYPALLEEVNNFVKVSEEEVKKNALDFCKAYELAMIEFSLDSKYSSFVSAKSASRYQKKFLYKRKVHEAFANFQNAINNFQNQIVKILYVYMDDEGQITLNVLDNDGKHFSLAKGEPRYLLDEIKNKLTFLDYDSSLLDATEQSIYTRWQIAASRRKKKTQAQRLPILWYIGRWYGALISNLGTIAEAYAGFYLSKYKFSGYLEQDVGTYIVNGAAAVDNASGFLQGDQMTEFKDLSVQWAVKKANAAPPNMKEVYDIVAKIKENFSVERFLEEFDKVAKKSQNQVTPLLGQQLSGKIRQLSSLYDEKSIGKSYTISID